MLLCQLPNHRPIFDKKSSQHFQIKVSSEIQNKLEAKQIGVLVLSSSRCFCRGLFYTNIAISPLFRGRSGGF